LESSDSQLDGHGSTHMSYLLMYNRIFPILNRASGLVSYSIAGSFVPN
jgi:hypothetical protein